MTEGLDKYGNLSKNDQAMLGLAGKKPTDEKGNRGVTEMKNGVLTITDIVDENGKSIPDSGK